MSLRLGYSFNFRWELLLGLLDVSSILSRGGGWKRKVIKKREGTVVACVKKHGLQVSEASALFFSSM